MNVNATFFTDLTNNDNTEFEVSEEEMAKAFAICLKDIRRFKRLTLKEVSENTDIPFQTIARYEKGENIPSIIQAYKLAYFYGMDLIDMFRAGYVCDADRENMFEEKFPNYIE